MKERKKVKKKRIQESEIKGENKKEEIREQYGNEKK